MTLEPFLYCGLAALLILSLAWQPWRRRHATNRAGHLGNTLGYAIGTFLAIYAMKGTLPGFPPTEGEHFWAYAALLCMAPAIAERRSWLQATLLGTAIFAAFVWLASEPLRENFWEGNQRWFHVGGAAGAGALLFALRPLPAASWASGPAYPGALAVASGCAAALLGQSYGGGAHVAGGLAFFPAVVATIAMLRPGRSYWPGLAASWCIGIPGLLLIGSWFAETPWTSGLMVALSPQLARLPLGQSTYPRIRAVLVAVAVALVGGLAIWLAYEPPVDYGDY